MDKIQNHENEYICITFKNKYIHPNVYFINDEIILKCYYIIKHMTQEDATAYMKKLNNKYDAHNDDECVNQQYLLHTQLLEYYFKPRGSHTKSAMFRNS
jgi:hypothetical protein